MSINILEKNTGNKNIEMFFNQLIIMEDCKFLDLIRKTVQNH